MAVTQLKDGRWMCYYDKDGKRKKKYFGRGIAAKQAAYEYNENLNLRKYTKSDNLILSPTFMELANQYIASKVGDISNSSIDNLTYKLTGVIFPEIGSTQALKITDHRLDQYKTKRLKTVKATTVHRELTDIKAILNWAVKKKFITHNPVANYQMPKRDDEIIMPPTKDECDAILKHAQPHLKRYLMLSYYLGLRPGQSELTPLKWQDVDWNKEVILVRSALKGGLKIRMVPVHPTLLNLMRVWQKEDEDNSTEKLQIENIVNWRGKPVKSLKKTFATAKKAAGIKRRLRFYDFRHHFATMLIPASGDLKSISEILGHSRPDTTMKIYQHTDVEKHRQAIYQLPDLGG